MEMCRAFFFTISSSPQCIENARDLLSFVASQQFFSHVGKEPPLSRYYQYFREVNVPCSRTQHGEKIYPQHLEPV